MQPLTQLTVESAFQFGGVILFALHDWQITQLRGYMGQSGMESSSAREDDVPV